MDEARLRAWKALELGPLWLSRRGPGVEDGEGADRAGSQAPGLAQAGSEAPAGPRAGSEATDYAQARGEAPDAPVPAGPPVEAPAAPAVPPGSPAPVSAESGGLDWAALQAAVEECRACALCETRTRTVFGTGPRDARWLVVGEAPGAEEDASGEPFVGQAGRLLDSMLASVGLDRGRNVFIANVLKCRPPGNRNPSPEEAARCLPFLRRQIELLQPDLVLLLGRVAAHALLETDAGVGSLRGRVHALRAGAREIPAVVTWHPSYLLRRPEDKALAWADLCLARAAFAKEG